MITLHIINDFIFETRFQQLKTFARSCQTNDLK